MKKGFTLIELLVVVLIIGILSAVALPQYRKTIARARAVEAIVAIKALTDAEELYYMANNEYTDDLTLLDVNVLDRSAYYTFSCFDNSYPSCLAKPKKEGYPVFEFTFKNGESGKHWCQVWDTPYRDNEQALQICKTFGPKDTTITHSDYYLM